MVTVDIQHPFPQIKSDACIVAYILKKILYYDYCANDVCFPNYQDALLEKYSTTEIFSEQDLQQIRRHKTSILVRCRQNKKAYIYMCAEKLLHDSD